MADYTLLGTWWPSLETSGNEYDAASLGTIEEANAWSATTMAMFQNFTKKIDLTVLGSYTLTSPGAGPAYKPFTISWNEPVELQMGRTAFTTMVELLESTDIGAQNLASGTIETTIPLPDTFDLYTVPPTGQVQGRRENFELTVFCTIGSNLDELGAATEPYIYRVDGIDEYTTITVVDLILQWDDVEVSDDEPPVETVVPRERNVGNSPLSFIIDSSLDLRTVAGTFSVDGTDCPVSPGWGFNLPIFDDGSDPYGGTNSISSDVTGTVTHLTPP